MNAFYFCVSKIRFLPIVAILTLTSDFGSEIWRIAALKANLLSKLPQVSIVDFYHDPLPFNIQRAAYRMLMAVDDFPQGTVHIVLQNLHQPVIGLYKGQYFISGNNGYLPLLSNSEIELKAIPGKDISILTDCIAQLFEGGNFMETLPVFKEMISLKRPSPYVKDQLLQGEVLFTDHYGNAITNIHRDDLNSFADETKASIVISRFESIDHITEDVEKEPDGNLYAHFNRAGYLQLAVKQGNAAQLLNLNEHKPITVKVNS